VVGLGGWVGVVAHALSASASSPSNSRKTICCLCIRPDYDLLYLKVQISLSPNDRENRGPWVVDEIDDPRSTIFPVLSLIVVRPAYNGLTVLHSLKKVIIS
jgi:hypothetical protein